MVGGTLEEIVIFGGKDLFFFSLWVLGAGPVNRVLPCSTASRHPEKINMPDPYPCITHVSKQAPLSLLVLFQTSTGILLQPGLHMTDRPIVPDYL